MSGKLTKFIYGLQHDTKKTPFGFLNNQTRISDCIVSCAGWFNIHGEKIGSGDLSLKDLDKVSKNIAAGEKFIVLGEGDSLWNIPSSSDSSAPGLDYVLQKCVWYIATGHIIRVRDAEAEEEVERNGVKYKRMKRSSFYDLIKYTPGKTVIPTDPVAAKKPLTVEDGMKAIVKKLGINPTAIPANPTIQPKTTTSAGATISPSTRLGPNGRPMIKKIKKVSSLGTIPVSPAAPAKPSP